ncbi:MAG: choice-of-anchor D domain-containing protein [Bryobacteraceae bacterium]
MKNLLRSALTLRTAAAMALLAASAGTAFGQTPQFTYKYRTATDTSIFTVPANGTLAFPPVLLGESTDLTFIAENNGPTPWTMTRLAVNNGAFRLESARDQLVNPNSSVPVTIRFSPPTIGRVSGRLTFELTAAQATVQVNFFLEASGVAPVFTTSYVVQPSGNQTLIEAGSTLPFPGTVVNATAQASFIVQNRGTGEGSIRNVTVSGEAYSVSGLPLLPAKIPADQVLRFNVNFNPKSRGQQDGRLTIDFKEGDQRVYILSGEGVGATFSYEWAPDSGTGGTVEAGGVLTLPDVQPGTPLTVTMTVRNTGNSPGDVRSVTLTGTGFALTPPALPQTLPVGGALRFTFTFTPRDAATVEGALRVDGAAIRVIGRGLGARWTFAARVGSVSTPLATGATYTFPNTVVGARGPVVTLVIRNEGNRTGNLAGITASPAVFRIQTLPALPVALEPNQTVEVPLQFAPAALGAVSGLLQVDDATINLRGIGDAPPDLPAVSFVGLGDSARPLEQPGVGLRLAEAYPYDITGTLTASFMSGSLVDDPAIQFASGGRTVEFRIPANTTQALFGQGASQVQFQTGTVAGDINLTAVFQVGTVRLSADRPVVKTLTVPADAPQIRDVRIGTQTASSFEILITGYSAARSVTQISLQFTGAAGASLQTTSLDVNVDGPFGAWYQSAASPGFGSQFTVAITIAVNGEVSAVQSVAVRATNARGTSNTVTANLR